MKFSRIGILGMVATSALLLTLGVAPAQASSIGTTATSARGDIVSMGACSAGWYYRSTSRGTDSLFKVGATQSNYNGTSSNASSTFTSEVSGTATATFSGGLNVGGSIKLVKISGTYGISTSASLTAKLGNSITITIPSKKTGNANYGVWRAYVKGYEDYTTTSCAVTKSVATTTYAPYKVGWTTWIS